MAFSGLMLTTNGKILYAKNDQGKLLNFTRVAVGEGILGTGESLVNRSALINEKMSMIIDAKQAVDGETATALLVTLKNEGLTVGFYFREIGIFAEDPDTKEEFLCLYDNAGEDGEYIPDEQSAVVVSERLRLLIARDGTQNVTINNSGNPLYLVFEDIEDDTVSTQRLWSSSKVHTEIDSAVAAHNTAAATHADIRQAASAAQATADEAMSIAQGRSRAVTYASYSALVAALNAMARTELRVGDNLYVQTKEVPDLWVSSVELASSAYSYTTDAALVTSLTAVGAVQMGYYKVAMLETAKVDLSGYVPIIRKVNGKALSADVTLRAADIAMASGDSVELTMSDKANVDWVKGLTRLPDAVGGTIAEAIANHVANGIRSGNFNAINCTDIPDGSVNWSFIIQFFAGQSTVVIAKRAYSESMWFREMDSTGWESGRTWASIATATPPQEYDLPLAAGYTAQSPCKYSKAQDNRVYVGVDAKTSGAIASATTIATLPAGYRPACHVIASVTCLGSTMVVGTLDVFPDGRVAVYHRSSDITWVSGQISFLAS